jgi:hypothetical protein
MHAARHPRYGIALTRAVLATRPASTRDAMAGAVQWLAVQRLVERARHQDGVHLLEEGLVQTLWTLGLRAENDGSTGSLPALAAHAGADLLVVVEAPVELVAARLATRISVHSRTQRLAESDQRSELLRGRELLHSLLGVIGGRQLLVVNDGRAATTDLARNIAEWVLRTA